MYEQLFGLSDYDGWSLLVEYFALAGNIDEYIARNHATLLEVFKQPHEPLPGVRSLLNELTARGVPIGVATAASKTIAEESMRSVGVRDYFKEIARSGLVPPAKPAPDRYLKAAELIGAPPDKCIAVEDSPTGLHSARAAGMFTVQVRASSVVYPPQPEADIVIETLEEFPLRLLV